jgi:putative transposase
VGICDAALMIVSLLCRTARALLSVPAVLLRRDTAKDAELLVLRHENAILRRHVKGRVRYEPADRFWLAALTSLIPRGRWAAVFPVTPPHFAGLAPQTDRQEVGLLRPQLPHRTPPTAAALKSLVLRLADENPRWATAASRANWPGSGTPSRLHGLGDPVRSRNRPHVLRWGITPALPRSPPGARAPGDRRRARRRA